MRLWWDPITQSRKCTSFKFTEEFCVMKMKNDMNFEEELTHQFKIDTNLMNCDARTQNLEKVVFNGLLLTKVYNICSKENWLLQIIICSKKNTEIVIFDDTDYWCQTWRKTDLCFQKWHEEFGKFSFTDWKIAISS